MRYLRLIGALTALSLATSAPAQSGMREIDAPAGTAWSHMGSGITLPFQVAGFDRVRINDTGSVELDIIANYESGGELLTVFVFKPQIRSTPLWMDRALDMIIHRPDFGMAGRVRPLPRPFKPAGAANNSGLRAAFGVGHPEYKSTGLAVMPLGSWLLKVRISSPNPDSARLDKLLSEVLNSLKVGGDAPAAEPVQDCSTALIYAPLKPVKASKDAAFASVLSASLIGAATIAPVPYCRQAPGSRAYGLFREIGSNSSYVAALADAGRAILLRPNAGLVGGTPTASSVTLLDLGRTLVYGDFQTLPEPEAVIAYVLRSEPLAVADFTGRDVKTTIVPPKKR